MKEENLDNRYATKSDISEVKEMIVESNRELIEAIHYFAMSVDERFTIVDKRFDSVESDIKELKTRTVKIESTMVTKDYLDEKLGDLRGDFTVLVRKEDNKMKTLVEVLVDKGVLDQKDKKKIYSLEPFAQS
jgi:hypothetical protein